MSDLLEKVKIEYVKGEAFIKVANLSKLSKIHPVILEIGQELLKNPQEAAIFHLATSELKKKSNEIESEIVRGLRRFLKLFSANSRLKVNSYLSEDNKLHFWFVIPAIRNKR